MDTVISIVLLLVGFVLLVKGADFFVEGSSSVAKKLKVPSIIIGLTIVAMGTSLPEAAVSVTASLANKNSLAISNVTGSNIFNLMVVIGVCSMMVPVAVHRDSVRRDIPISILCILLLMAMGAADYVVGHKGMGMVDFIKAKNMKIGHIDGVILLICFALFLAMMLVSALKARKSDPTEEETEGNALLPVSRCILYIVGGAAAIVFGGNLVVDHASALAIKMGMSETLVGLTIVSVGTSLPELVTSVVAARKNEVDMALGNAIGSNIFNILLIVGLAGTISPVSFIMANLIDLAVLMVCSLVVWLFSATHTRINRAEGLVMVLMYCGYLAYIIMRDGNIG